MAASTFKAVHFVPKDDKDFGITVRKRVNEYFKSNKIERTGDYRIWIKVVILPLMYITPFVLLLTNVFAGNMWIYYSLWVMMGIGLAGCGLGIMHDACHGAISKNKIANDIVAKVMNLAGGSVLNWKIQHNVLHHSYTNIDGYDEDIDPAGVMRFSPHQPKKAFYKYQAYYAWFLYGLMTFFWMTTKDFKQLYRYYQKGLLESQGITYPMALARLIFGKIIYYAIFMGLPFFLLDVAWYHIILGWFSMHFMGGLILACIFQPAHVMPTSEFPMPDENNNVEGDRSIHQLLTTSNFAPNNFLLSWYVGGLNFQIEHHLFPTMSHIHHKKVSKIVKKTAEEFGLPYNSQPTFLKALVAHAKVLYKLGR